MNPIVRDQAGQALACVYFEEERCSFIG